MKKIAALIVGTAAALIFSASPASAQPNAISAGFSCQKWNSDFCQSKGFAVDFRHDIHTAPSTATSIVVDFGWNRFTDEETDTSFVAGVRETFMRENRVSFFAQGTAGIMHWKESFPFDESGNDFLVGGGGGVIVNLTDMLGVVGQLDFWGAHDRDADDWDPVTRLTIKVVWKFGSK